MTSSADVPPPLDERVQEIKRAVLDRVATLQDDLEGLVGRYEGAGDDSPSSGADGRQGAVAWSLLQELLDYPDAARKHIEGNLEHASRPRTQARGLREVAKDVVEATSRIQQWFASMHSSDVPSALEEALSSGIEALEIPDQLGFVAAGNANQLDTVVDDARRAIFQDTPEPALGETDERRDKRPVAVFRSPHHEAKAPRYWPIVLGHELAHLKIGTDARRAALEDARRQASAETGDDVTPEGTPDGQDGVLLGEVQEDPTYLLNHLDLMQHFDFDELYRIFTEEQEAKLRKKPPAPTIGQVERKPGGRHTSGTHTEEEASPPVQECLQTANDWVEEVVCDLFMVRKFGPAGIAAMANYLTAVGAYIAWTPSHPPGYFRMQLMSAYLGAIPDEIEPLVAPWRAPLLPRGMYPSPWADALMRFVSGNFEAIAAFVDGWPGERYDIADEARRSAVVLALRQLKFGLPPFSSRADSFSDAPSAEQTEQDAGTTGSHEPLQSAPTGHVPTVAPDPSPMVQLTAADVINAGWLAVVRRAGNDPSVHSKIPIDRLSLKSVETLRLLEIHPGISATVTEVEEPGLSTEQTPGAILGYEEIQRRLAEPSHWRRIIVTPRIDDHNTTASLDVRLGNRFIVFQRTGISSFNAAQGSSPRAVQRLVERPFLAPFVLHPGEVVLASALEYIALPLDIGAQVITRSAYGRLGLITATAVQVHPLYRGCLTLELVNLGTVPLTLYPGERVAQLVFFNVQSPAPSRDLKPEELFDGSFVCPTAPEFPNVQVDSWIKP